MKKIVAREGLIILGVLLLSAAAFAARSYFEKQFRALPDYGSVYTAEVKKTERSYTLPARSQDDLMNRLREIVDHIGDDDPKAWIAKKYGHEIDIIENRERYRELEEAMSKASVFFLFFAYPVYLVIRFVCWAIPVVRGSS